MIGDALSNGAATVEPNDGAVTANEVEHDTQRDAASGAPDAPKRKRGSFFAPIRIANFRRLVAGQTISRFGDQFYYLAIPWLVLRITPSPLVLAAVLGVASLSLGIFTLVGGVLADRLGPRTLMMAADAARLVIMATLAALALLMQAPPLWSIIALSALLGLASGLFYPASGAMIPYLVPKDDLQAANSYDQLTFQSANFIGPGIAGALLSATQLAVGFVVDTASFVISLLTLASLRMPKRERVASEGAKPRGGMASLGEGFRFLLNTKFLVTLLGVSLLGSLAINGLFDVGLPLLLKQRVGLMGGPQAQGIVVGGFGLGSVLGAVIAGVTGRVSHKPLVGILLFVPFAALTAVVPLVPGLLPMAVVFAVMGLVGAASNVLLVTVIQSFIPLDMMGRITSFMMLGSFLGAPLSIFIYGGLATVVPSVSWLFYGGAILMGLALLIALTRKVVWQTA
ncbi:MAG: MFS transporter [Ktedonobacterales bacterium]